ncbi:DUF3052 domain-containing protein [Ornithinimicrobium pratense]|uniref:DUF3052 domain-containing protein n=2 Tax=Ornithinimicrobium pratense TaxID=2593973 RepID=A0A5J6V8V5_9MICO|nr:DUF3052 domain-containing protein [Ornithinimicrobium pratense]
MGAALRKLGLRPGQIVVEYGFDDDVEESVRDAVEALAEGPLEDEDYDGVVDVVLLWWRDGDGDLTDELMDSLTRLEEGGSIVLLTPGTGRPDRVPAPDVQEACTTCSLSASGFVPVQGWVGQRLVGRR